ncbi:MAG: hypothetical protein K1X75_08695 [Leptospirales bacterium]|nr:hypothetical protein [Leptospirales bacterium]
MRISHLQRQKPIDCKKAPTSLAPMFCINCGIEAPLAKVSYKKNIGLLVMRQYQTFEGAVCRPCRDSLFSSYFLTTLFAGWWGVISFIVTPFYLLATLFSYIGTRDLQSPPVGARRPTLSADEIQRIAAQESILVEVLNGGGSIEDACQRTAAAAGVQPAQAFLFLQARLQKKQPVATASGNMPPSSQPAIGYQSQGGGAASRSPSASSGSSFLSIAMLTLGGLALLTVVGIAALIVSSESYQQIRRDWDHPPEAVSFEQMMESPVSGQTYRVNNVALLYPLSVYRYETKQNAPLQQGAEGNAKLRELFTPLIAGPAWRLRTMRRELRYAPEGQYLAFPGVDHKRVAMLSSAGFAMVGLIPQEAQTKESMLLRVGSFSPASDLEKHIQDIFPDLKLTQAVYVKEVAESGYSYSFEGRAGPLVGAIFMVLGLLSAGFFLLIGLLSRPRAPTPGSALSAGLKTGS